MVFSTTVSKGLIRRALADSRSAMGREAALIEEAVEEKKARGEYNE